MFIQICKFIVAMHLFSKFLTYSEVSWEMRDMFFKCIFSCGPKVPQTEQLIQTTHTHVHTHTDKYSVIFKATKSSY